LRFSDRPIGALKKNWKWLLLGGVLGGVGITLAFLAFSLGSLGAVTALFKLSMIFVPILGWLFFKEHNIRQRIVGSVIMLVGVILLVT